MYRGVDVSKHNGNINWSKVKNEMNFAIIRCGYGMDQTNQDDEQYANNVKGCIENGIPFGVYLYSYANTLEKAQSEAEHILRLVNPYKDKITLGIWYDIEDKIQRDLGKDFLEQIINTFCSKVKESGYNVGIYANKDWFTNRISDNVKNSYPLWVAGYGNNNGEPHYNYRYEHNNMIMFQYTSKGNVEGISGNVDLNEYYGDELKVPEVEEKPVEEKPSKDIYNDGLVNCIYDIQEWLNRHYNTGLALDNIYGPKTKAALIKGLQTELNTQYNKGLAVDGIFGNATKNACINVREGAEGNITMLIQMALFIKRYNIDMDKKFGSKTAKIVGQFQNDNGLTSDKIVGKNTFQKLFA